MDERTADSQSHPLRQGWNKRKKYDAKQDERHVPPDSRAKVTRAGSEELAGRAGRNGNDCEPSAIVFEEPSERDRLADGSVSRRCTSRSHRVSSHRTIRSAKLAQEIERLTGVLMALKHQLSCTAQRVPELNASVFGAAQHPESVRSEGNAENKVLQHRVSIH